MKRLILISCTFLMMASAGCKTTSSATMGQENDDSYRASRAAFLESALIKDLTARNGSAQGTAWFVSKAKLEPDWLIQSPAGYWGKKAASLPKDLSCNGNDPGCDPQFSRHLCQTDGDCALYQTTCQVLTASVYKPGDPPRRMCLGSGDELLNRFYNAMVATQTHLEITTLSNPTWRFWTMMVNALTVLSQKNPAPTVRILMSGRNSTKPNADYPIQPVLDEITSEIQRLGGNMQNVHIDIGYLSNGMTVSWNHTKIVLVDGNRVIQGGHNMWDPDYLEDHPIFDASMEFYGEAAAATQAFVAELWSHVPTKTFANYPPRTERGWMGGDNPLRMTPPKLQATTRSDVKVIGLGRLGSFGANPSDTAFHSLIQNAKDTLYLAQEDIFSRIYVCDANAIQERLNLGHPGTLNDLVDAIFRGVKVKIVQSDQIGEGVSGYAMMPPRDSANFIIEALVREAQRRKITPPAGQSLAQYVCGKFEIAPWRFTAGEKFWGDNKRKIGSHPKIIIADSSVFYLGSHNIYPGNLQEFGMVVTDPGVAKELIDKYWNEVWSASQPDKMGCDLPDAQLLPTRISYQEFLQKLLAIARTKFCTAVETPPDPPVPAPAPAGPAGPAL